MSTEKALARPAPEGDASTQEEPKRARYERCFSGLEFRMESRPLKDLDPDKLRKEIKRWAKAVVRFARQLSGSFSSRDSSRQLSGSFSPRGSGRQTRGSFSSHGRSDP